jgi:hypothetical protein
MGFLTREKRRSKVQGYITDSLKQFVEEQVAANPSKTESDVVFEALELKRVIVIAEQKIGPRVGRN